jgi:hypothetical protein
MSVRDSSAMIAISSFDRRPRQYRNIGATEPENVIRSFVTLLDLVRDYDVATATYGSMV